MLQLLLIIGVWRFFSHHTSEIISKCTNETRLQQRASSDASHSPLEARPILLLSSGGLLAPPPDNVQDAGSPVTHDDVTNVTLSSSLSSLCSCYIIVTLHNDIPSQCHITQLHRILQDYSLMSELPHSRLLSPVAGDRLGQIVPLKIFRLSYCPFTSIHL